MCLEPLLGASTDSQTSVSLSPLLGDASGYRTGRQLAFKNPRSEVLAQRLPQHHGPGCECHPTRAWTARTWRTVQPEAPSSLRTPNHSLFGGQCDSSLRVHESADKECLQGAPLTEPKVVRRKLE